MDRLQSRRCISQEMEEAARIDGCTPWQSFRRVILPLAVPGLVITALFSFMTAWSEYIVAAQILQDRDLFTLPLGLRGVHRRESGLQGLALLARVGLVNRANDFPVRVSGGEQWRVAFARALVKQPEVVLADESTGILDEVTGAKVLHLRF